MQKKVVIPVDFNERITVQVVQGLSVLTGAPLYCTKGDRTIDMNSILGLLSLNIKQGDTVTFDCADPKKIQRIEEILFFQCN